MPAAGSVAESTEEADDSTDLLEALGRVRREHGTATVACRFRCGTGEVFDGRWRGVRLGDLLASAPPETTHVRALSADGYCAPVAVVDALDAVVATERLDAPPEGLPRLVGESLDSTETVREMVRLEPVALPPEADPEPTVVTGDDSEAIVVDGGDPEVTHR